MQNKKVRQQQSASVSGFFEEPPLFPNGLRAHLATNSEGRLALRSGVNLDHTSRTHLVRSVVEYLFKYFSCKNKINSQILQKAAAEIVLEYLNEKTSVYFVPGKPKKKHSSRTLSSGKLFNRYRKVLRKLGGLVVEHDSDYVPNVENVEGMFPEKNKFYELRGSDHGTQGGLSGV
ncbi:uncharacterized protein LOC117175504 [Belonocnema kinseyi]|uniref:uncharacterized protein LOC117175504 n=1 Tax=Belonocnema kinseyi TaxID=2817044 RepID=UPI00143CCD2B|nr:uncharacterized protein LOC117175504 [Belonocnema kinseyi]